MENNSSKERPTSKDPAVPSRVGLQLLDRALATSLSHARWFHGPRELFHRTLKVHLLIDDSINGLRNAELSIDDSCGLR